MTYMAAQNFLSPLQLWSGQWNVSGSDAFNFWVLFLKEVTLVLPLSLILLLTTCILEHSQVSLFSDGKTTRKKEGGQLVY